MEKIFRKGLSKYLWKATNFFRLEQWISYAFLILKGQNPVISFSEKFYMHKTQAVIVYVTYEIQW